MSVQRILLTGDDGYNSIGTRLLIHALKDTYDLAIAGTKTQQSGVGGKISVQHGGTWNETTIDGVPAFWVDGTPGDAMECASAYFPKKFDLILSGMNLGENISMGVVASGTVSAAQRGVVMGIAPQAISLSWMVPPAFYFKKHDEKEDISEHMEYPGKVLKCLITLCITEKLWGARMLNINLPKDPTATVRFTRFTEDTKDCYPSVTLRDSDQTYAYPFEEGPRKEHNVAFDVAAITQGYISITPQTPDWTDLGVYEKVKDRQLTLE